MPNISKQIKQRVIADENWLSEYGQFLAPVDGLILELGCGRGRDTGELLNHGPVLATDRNADSLKELKATNPSAHTFVSDLGRAWPLRDHAFSFVLGSLSLHYFSDSVTRECVLELKRVLRPSGTALLRFNSTNDVNYGANASDLIEPDFFNVKGQPKRFFSRTALLEYFSGWQIDHLEEVEIDRYKHTKVVWEMVCRPR